VSLQVRYLAVELRGLKEMTYIFSGTNKALHHKAFSGRARKVIHGD
jgi:hypothetical protein